MITFSIENFPNRGRCYCIHCGHTIWSNLKEGKKHLLCGQCKNPNTVEDLIKTSNYNYKGLAGDGKKAWADDKRLLRNKYEDRRIYEKEINNYSTGI